MSTSHGGPTRTVLLTMQGIRSLGMDVEIVTNQPASGEVAVSNDPSIRYVPRFGFKEKHFGYSKAIAQELVRIENVDIYHIQGIWLYSGYITARYARKQGCPYLITLHGTLYISVGSCNKLPVFMLLVGKRWNITGHWGLLILWLYYLTLWNVMIGWNRCIRKISNASVTWDVCIPAKGGRGY